MSFQTHPGGRTLGNCLLNSRARHHGTPTAVFHWQSASFVSAGTPPRDAPRAKDQVKHLGRAIPKLPRNIARSRGTALSWAVQKRIVPQPSVTARRHRQQESAQSHTTHRLDPSSPLPPSALPHRAEFGLPEERLHDASRESTSKGHEAQSNELASELKNLSQTLSYLNQAVIASVTGQHANEHSQHRSLRKPWNLRSLMDRTPPHPSLEVPTATPMEEKYSSLARLRRGLPPRDSRQDDAGDAGRKDILKFFEEVMPKPPGITGALVTQEISAAASPTTTSLVSASDDETTGRSPLRDGFIAHGKLTYKSLVLERIVRTSDDVPVPKLAHGLDRVLFNPSPYMLQDSRSGVYNFPAELQKIPAIEDFDFERSPRFRPSSAHKELQELAKKHGRTFIGSTSSLSGLLSQVYFLISKGSPINTSDFSSAFTNEPTSFTPAARMPARVSLHYKDGVYSTDADKGAYNDDDSTILSDMGVMLEHYLTKSPDQFATLLKGNDGPPEPATEQPYQYTLTSNLLMRSQLDCWDPRLGGTGFFDVKTRATVAIRHDVDNYKESSGYLIRTLKGEYESYEREQYDLLRSGMLKYFFQAHIGNMKGIFIAYHNTLEIFGFQYMPLEEMANGLFGTERIGEKVFRICVALLEKIMDAIQLCCPQQSCRVIFENSGGMSGLRVWITPIDSGYIGEPPQVTELNVTVKHYTGSPLRQTSGPSVRHGKYAAEYAINRTSPSPLTRARRDEAIQRFDSIKKGKKSPTGEFKARLRHLAQIGRHETARRERESQGLVQELKGLLAEGSAAPRPS